MKQVAKVIYSFDDEEDGVYQSAVIEHEGSLWLIATWFESNDTTDKHPDRIVPLTKLDPAEQDGELIALRLKLPRALLSRGASLINSTIRGCNPSGARSYPRTTVPPLNSSVMVAAPYNYRFQLTGLSAGR